MSDSKPDDTRGKCVQHLNMFSPRTHVLSAAFVVSGRTLARGELRQLLVQHFQHNTKQKNLTHVCFIGGRMAGNESPVLVMVDTETSTVFALARGKEQTQTYWKR